MESVAAIGRQIRVRKVDMAHGVARMRGFDSAAKFMAKSNICQSIGSLAPGAQQRIIDRLEFRGRDPVFRGLQLLHLSGPEAGINETRRLQRRRARL